ncbi:MAG: hypothetical protein JSU89_12160 [Myxococcales bacterium]|nr:MAG: hypothetical protein JSU89_12160 [Myxococcales bacterium]
MPHPDEDPELPGTPGKAARRPSHFRKKRRDTTTKVVRVARAGAHGSDLSHVVHNPRAPQEHLTEVINPSPTLPDPLLQRPLPPPAPLPSQTSRQDPTVPGWLEDRQRRKRAEDIIGTVGLALMVAAMLTAMWLRMTGP